MQLIPVHLRRQELRCLVAVQSLTHSYVIQVDLQSAQQRCTWLSLTALLERRITMFILRRHRNPGDALVRRSIELNQPVIFAAMNYRVNGENAVTTVSLTLVHCLSIVFGFLGGREVSEAGVGNLGLHDREHILRIRRRPS